MQHFREKLYRPDIINRILNGESIDEAVEAATRNSYLLARAHSDAPRRSAKMPAGCLSGSSANRTGCCAWNTESAVGPARILIQPGTSEEISHWIEKNVVRVGSDPNSDVVILNAAVEPQALTVEFRQTGYRVYNRGSRHVVLGGQLLESNQHADWFDSDLLELQDGVSVALDVGEDPAPGVPPLSSVASEFEPSFSGHEVWNAHETSGDMAQRSSSAPGTRQATQTQDARSGFKTTIQLAISLLCLLGCTGLIIRHQSQGASVAKVDAPKFEAVVERARQPGTAVSAELLDQLQLAEAARIRTQAAIARQRYQRLYDSLVRATAATTDGNPDSAEELDALQQLIKDRLQNLN